MEVIMKSIGAKLSLVFLVGVLEAIVGISLWSTSITQNTAIAAANRLSGNAFEEFSQEKVSILLKSKVDERTLYGC
jgi:hypothetical protein